MKNVAMFLCLIVSGYGLYSALTVDFFAGSIVLFLGALCFLCLVSGNGKAHTNKRLGIKG